MKRTHRVAKDPMDEMRWCQDRLRKSSSVRPSGTLRLSAEGSIASRWPHMSSASTSSISSMSFDRTKSTQKQHHDYLRSPT